MLIRAVLVTFHVGLCSIFFGSPWPSLFYLDNEMKLVSLEKMTMMMTMTTTKTTIIDSNLPTIMLVATKVHMISRRYAVLTWMCDKKELE